MNPETGATVYIELANLFSIAGRYDGRLWAAEHAVACARPTGNDWRLAEAMAGWGAALIPAESSGRGARGVGGSGGAGRSLQQSGSLVRSLTSLADRVASGNCRTR